MTLKLEREVLDVELWKERRREVWERDERRCVTCAKLLTLEQAHIHHRMRRSYVRDDNPKNLHTLCWDCHSKIHA